MRVHYLQHVPFENPETILDWAAERGRAITSTSFFSTGWSLPSVDEVDSLVVMVRVMDYLLERA